jgi:riboflavin kinase/FMN adenylyltransferase
VTRIVPLTNVAPASQSGTGDAAGSGQGSKQPVLASVPESIRGGVISIGNFDGVHRGHAALLSDVRRKAVQSGGPAVAVVLDPHPAALLRPENSVTRLTTIPRRAELMEALGIDALVVCQTSREFLKMTAAEFFQSLVVDRLQARAIIEGPNFFFGRDRGGDIGVLAELCKGSGVDLQIVRPAEVDGQMISSTRIRGELEAGRVEAAAGLLGSAYRISGTVMGGAKRGRQIGYPTANLGGIEVVIPAAGVYGGLATTTGQPPYFRAAIHVGPSPTFEHGGGTKVEIHLLDFAGDLYGQTLKVDFIHRLRDIARFESADRLVEQLDQDMKAIRSHLAPAWPQDQAPRR